MGVLPARSLGPTFLPVPLSHTVGTIQYARLRQKRRRERPGANAAKQETEDVVIPPSAGDVDNCDYNVGAFCSIDEQGKRVGKRSMGEMEQEFLEALRAWYYDGTAVMTNEEFELLKEELIWQGSTVAVLSSSEQKFLEASMAYSAGRPIISDAEYDALKNDLKQSNSLVAIGGPRCSLRSRKMYADLEVDYLRMLLLNVPATVLVLGVLFFFDDITGFEITKLIELPEPWGIIALWGVVLPACFVFSNAITNFVLRDGLILKGLCPNCGTENLSYFGNIFTVEGNTEKSEVKCPECSSALEFSNKKREIVVTTVGEQR